MYVNVREQCFVIVIIIIIIIIIIIRSADTAIFSDTEIGL